MQNHSVRLLDLEIKKNGFIYRQIKRSENKFIYAQYNAADRLLGYELFLNKLGDLRKAKERWAKLQNKSFVATDYEEFYETFPGDEEFGKRAWNYRDLNQALLAFDTK